jgi:hypothetical protein
MSASYKNKLRLIEGDYINHNLKENTAVKSFFKIGLLIISIIFTLLYLSKI